MRGLDPRIPIMGQHVAILSGMARTGPAMTVVGGAANPYLAVMKVVVLICGVAAMTIIALPAHAQTDDERYTIIRPEPSARAAQPLYVPQTGQTLPNLPTVAPSGPGGRETYQDRAARCAHQAGVYGQAAGDRNAYVGACINQ